MDKTIETAETYLAGLHGAAPEMGELRRLGISLDSAIAICQNAANERKRSEPAAVPIKPIVLRIPKSTAPVDALDPMLALSLLHTLFQEAERGRPASATTLHHAGWSVSTSLELAQIITASLSAQPRVTRR
jgi:hypothetical protein